LHGREKNRVTVSEWTFMILTNKNGLNFLASIFYTLQRLPMNQFKTFYNYSEHESKVFGYFCYFFPFFHSPKQYSQKNDIATIFVRKLDFQNCLMTWKTGFLWLFHGWSVIDPSLYAKMHLCICNRKAVTIWMGIFEGLGMIFWGIF
jgi:hypothetical protein